MRTKAFRRHIHRYNDAGYQSDGSLKKYLSPEETDSSDLAPLREPMVDDVEMDGDESATDIFGGPDARRARALRTMFLESNIRRAHNRARQQKKGGSSEDKLKNAERRQRRARIKRDQHWAGSRSATREVDEPACRNDARKQQLEEQRNRLLRGIVSVGESRNAPRTSSVCLVNDYAILVPELRRELRLQDMDKENVIKVATRVLLQRMELRQRGDEGNSVSHHAVFW